MAVIISQGRGGAVSYKQTVLADAPLAYWRMDDTNSTMLDVSGNGHNGTHTASPTLSQAGALSTDTNTAVKYNGSTQYSSAAIDLSAQTRITVEFWLYWTAFATDDKLACETGPSNFSVSNGFYVDPDDSTVSGGTMMSFGMGNGATWTDAIPRPTANAWHHYALDLNHVANRNVTDAVTNGGTTITSATANFTAGDIGRVLLCATNIAVGTTIASVTNSTTAILSTAAGAGSGQTVYFGPWTNLAYVDGVAQSLTPATHNGILGSNFGNLTVYFMCRPGASPPGSISLVCPANSLMDEFAIYSGGLSPARIAAHYSAGRYIGAQNLVGGVANSIATNY